MKKSVILIILAVYLLSIVAVGFFGMKVTVYDETIYVTNIEIYGVTVDGDDMVLKDDSGTGVDQYCVIAYEEGLVAFINYRATPDNASNRDVTLFTDKESTCATVNRNGTVEFTAQGAVTVFIKATDGSGKINSVTIFARKR